jgi:hypothetical protein
MGDTKDNSYRGGWCFFFPTTPFFSCDPSLSVKVIFGNKPLAGIAQKMGDGQRPNYYLLLLSF